MEGATATLASPGETLGTSKGKHVIILGKGDSRRYCPFDTEVWGINNVGNDFRGPNGEADRSKPIKMCFAFDNLPPEYVSEMKRSAPVCSWQNYADVKYPLREILDKFKTRYFTNTVSYMLAYAIYTGVTKLSLYGIDMCFGSMYAMESRGVEYWLARCEEHGIEIEMFPGSHILRTTNGKLYGERGDFDALLYFEERLSLLNTLPKEGSYEDMCKSQICFWVLIPKQDEATRYKIEIQQNPDGSTKFRCPNEFQSEILIPDGAWQFLYKILKEKQQKGQLNYSLVSCYEKIVLAHPGLDIEIPVAWTPEMDTRARQLARKETVALVTPK